MTDLKLSQIWVYPIKSLGGIRLPSAKVREKGLVNDRRWMLIDGQGSFMTQRTFPAMALLQPSFHGDTISVVKKNATTPSSAGFSVKRAPGGEAITTRVWDDEVEVIEVDPAVSQWFSDQLGTTCRLVSFPEENSRPTKKGNKSVSLADAYPFMMIGQSSLDELNSRLADPLPMNRFRPNFVFTGGRPFEEDAWKHFSIGKTRFTTTSPCARCALTTVDQDTAEKGAEPLLTLSRYRKADNKVLFGQNLIADEEGEVAVGDKIAVT